MSPLMRPVRELHGRRNVPLCTSRNHGKEPPLICHRSRKTEIRAYPVIASSAYVRQRAAAGNELLTDLLMPEVELKAVPSVKPVIRPCLRTLPLSANPTADQVSAISVSTSPCAIEKVEAVTESAPERVIRVNPLNPQIQLLNLGEVRKIKPCVPRGTVEITNRRKFVVRKTVAVERQPVAQTRDPVAEIHSGAPVPRFHWTTCHFIARGEQAAEECVRGQGIARPPVDGCSEHTELKISCGFEADLLTMKEWLL